jgi:hypothetical protein
MKFKDRLKKVKKEIKREIKKELKKTGKIIEKVAKGALHGAKEELKKIKNQEELNKTVTTAQHLLQQPGMLQQFQQFTQQNRQPEQQQIIEPQQHITMSYLII